MTKTIAPDYKNYSFANIPSTIFTLFGQKTKRPVLPEKTYKGIVSAHPVKIIFLLVDGLGFNAWEKYGQDLQGLKIIKDRGRVSPLTAVFPTTTAAALTTFYSGTTPQEHGLFEWFVYFPELGKIIATLPFSLPGGKPDSLLNEGINPDILYSGKTIFQTLGEANVISYSFINRLYANSSYTRLISRGSMVIPYNNGSDLMTKLSSAVNSFSKQSFYYVYWDRLDHSAHEFGPDSKEYLKELQNISFLIKKLLEKLNQKNKEETILIITADHGEINIDPQRTIFLNKIKGINDFLKLNPGGQPILPFGNPRDLFLHVKEEKLNECKKFLENNLEKKAEVILTKELIERGLFGIGKPSGRFLERVGNLAVLPTDNNTVWYQYPNVLYPNFLGHHGGLTEDEMLIPFAVMKASL